MTETAELRGVAVRQLEALEADVLEMRGDVLRAAQAAEAALGYEQALLGSGDQDLASLLSTIRRTILRLEVERSVIA